MRQSKLTAWLLGFPGIMIAIAFILISVHQSDLVKNKQANQIEFKDTYVFIQGAGTSTKIQYEDVQSLDLVDHVDTVRAISDDYFNGIAETKDYGDCTSYVYPKVKRYIIIETKKKNYIVNEFSIKETKKLYRKWKQRL